MHKIADQDPFHRQNEFGLAVVLFRHRGEGNYIYYVPGENRYLQNGRKSFLAVFLIVIFPRNSKIATKTASCASSSHPILAACGCLIAYLGENCGCIMEYPRTSK
jgi:hypothetical protein